MISKLKLSHILGVQFALWTLCSMVVHGPQVLAYVALQVLTSGVFAFAIQRSYMKYAGSTPEAVVRLETESATGSLAGATARQAG